MNNATTTPADILVPLRASNMTPGTMARTKVHDRANPGNTIWIDVEVTASAPVESTKGVELWTVRDSAGNEYRREPSMLFRR